MKANQVYVHKQYGDRVVIMSVRKYTAEEQAHQRPSAVRSYSTHKVVFCLEADRNRRSIPVEHLDAGVFEDVYELVANH